MDGLPSPPDSSRPPGLLRRCRSQSAWREALSPDTRSSVPAGAAFLSQVSEKLVSSCGERGGGARLSPSSLSDGSSAGVGRPSPSILLSECTSSESSSCTSGGSSPSPHSAVGQDSVRALAHSRHAPNPRAFKSQPHSSSDSSDSPESARDCEGRPCSPGFFSGTSSESSAELSREPRVSVPMSQREEIYVADVSDTSGQSSSSCSRISSDTDDPGSLDEHSSPRSDASQAGPGPSRHTSFSDGSPHKSSSHSREPRTFYGDSDASSCPAAPVSVSVKRPVLPSGARLGGHPMYESLPAGRLTALSMPPPELETVGSAGRTKTEKEAFLPVELDRLRPVQRESGNVVCEASQQVATRQSPRFASVDKSCRSLASPAHSLSPSRTSPRSGETTESDSSCSPSVTDFSRSANRWEKSSQLPCSRQGLVSCRAPHQEESPSRLPFHDTHCSAPFSRNSTLSHEGDELSYFSSHLGRTCSSDSLTQLNSPHVRQQPGVSPRTVLKPSVVSSSSALFSRPSTSALPPFSSLHTSATTPALTYRSASVRGKKGRVRFQENPVHAMDPVVSASAADAGSAPSPDIPVTSSSSPADEGVAKETLDRKPSIPPGKVGKKKTLVESKEGFTEGPRDTPLDVVGQAQEGKEENPPPKAGSPDEAEPKDVVSEDAGAASGISPSGEESSQGYSRKGSSLGHPGRKLSEAFQRRKSSSPMPAFKKAPTLPPPRVPHAEVSRPDSKTESPVIAESSPAAVEPSPDSEQGPVGVEAYKKEKKKDREKRKKTLDSPAVSPPDAGGEEQMPLASSVDKDRATPEQSESPPPSFPPRAGSLGASGSARSPEVPGGGSAEGQGGWVPTESPEQTGISRLSGRQVMTEFTSPSVEPQSLSVVPSKDEKGKGELAELKTEAQVGPVVDAGGRPGYAGDALEQVDEVDAGDAARVSGPGHGQEQNVGNAEVDERTTAAEREAARQKRLERRAEKAQRDLKEASQVNLNLRIASVARMQTSGCRFPGLSPIPDRIKGGVTKVPGAYGTAASLKVCAVAWLPEEDPLELLGIAQGVHWLPGWGSRVTTAVSTRPTMGKNALGLDDADFNQEVSLQLNFSEAWRQRMTVLEQTLRDDPSVDVSFESAGRVVQGVRLGPTPNRVVQGVSLSPSPGGDTSKLKEGPGKAESVNFCFTPVALVSIVHITQQLTHALAPSVSPYRPADPRTYAQNAIEPGQRVRYPEDPGVKVVGTAVLPLRKLNRERGIAVDKHELLLMDMDKAPAVTVHANGTLTYLHACRLFKHDVIREVTLAYKEALKRLQPVSLLSLIETASARLTPVGELLLSLDSIDPVSIRFDRVLGDRWRPTCADPSGLQRLRDDNPDARLRCYPAAHAVWIEINRVLDVPIEGMTLRQLCDAQLSIVAAWAGEGDCPALFKRSTRRLKAPSRCQVQPLKFSAIPGMSRAEDSFISCSVRGQVGVLASCFFHSSFFTIDLLAEITKGGRPLPSGLKVCLPFYPGIDPQVNLYLCLNDRVYASLLVPLDLSTYTPEQGLRASDRSFRSIGGRFKVSRIATKVKDPVADISDSSSSEEDEDFFRDKGTDDLMEWFAKTGVPKHVRDRFTFRKFRLVRYISEDGYGDEYADYILPKKFGVIELRVFPCPEDGIFMKAAEFNQLRLKPPWEDGIFPDKYRQNAPNQYGGPVVGFFGSWTAFGDDFDPPDACETPGEEEPKVKDPKAPPPVSAFFSPAPVHLQYRPDKPGGGKKKTKFKRDPSSEPTRSPGSPALDTPTGSPLNAQVVHSPRGEGPVVSNMCVAKGECLSVGRVGTWERFILTAKNAKGETVRDPGGIVSLRFSPVGLPDYSFGADPTGALSVATYRADARFVGNSRVGNLFKDDWMTPFEWQVESKRDDGHFVVSYKHERPGYWLMHLMYDGLEIAGSPFEVQLVSGTASPAACRIVGLGSKTCFASPSPHMELPHVRADEALALMREQARDEDWKSGKTADYRKRTERVKLKTYVNQFKIAICDDFGNRVATGGHCITVKGFQGAQILNVIDEGHGTYRVDYLVHIPKSLLQETGLDILARLDSFALETRAQPNASLPEEAIGFEDLRGLDLPLYTEAVIEVLLYEKPLFGTPLKPRICNFVEVHREYAEIDRVSVLGVQIGEFERLLHEGAHAQAAELLWKVDDMVDQKELKQQIMGVIERLVRERLEHEDAMRREEADTAAAEDLLGPMTTKELEAKRKKDLNQIRRQWEDVQLLRELLLKLTKNFSDRESIVSRFTFSMVERLQQTQAAHLRLMAEHHNLQRLEHENLIPLAHMLQAQYIHMFKQMTHEIVRLVRGVENKQFVNLENLLQTYRKIGDELRRLHRYHLAGVLDQINDCVVEEIELQRLAHITRAKEVKIYEIEQKIAEKEKALEEERTKHEEAMKNVKPLNMVEIQELSTTKRQAGVQTEDALSLRQGIFGPLIVARATGQHLPQGSEVVAAVKKSWRSCNVYDIHTTIKRLLKCCPRLKHCIEEVFLHYAKVTMATATDLQVEGLPVGLPQTVFLRFCNDARVEEHLLADPAELQNLFEKFSIEPDTGRIRVDGFLRVIPLFLWLPCLRELAYLDLLHAICRECLEKGQDPRAALRRDHPSRMTAFHYFCRERFLPLYQMLYHTDDFRVSNKSLVAGELILKQQPASTHRLWNVLAYSREKLPYDVFSMLRLEPMEHLFVFYSELAMKPSLGRSRDDPLFPTARAAARKDAAATKQEGGPAGGPPGSSAPGVTGLRRLTTSQFGATKGGLLLETQSSLEGDGAEHASRTAWVSVGVFVQMWREFGVVPGFIDVDMVIQIAKVAIGKAAGEAVQTHVPRQEGGHPDDEDEDDEEEDSGDEDGEETGFRRLLSLPGIPGETIGPTGRRKKGKPASHATKGRLHFSNFVEAVVNVVCECTARALLEEAGSEEHPASLEATEAEIKKKAVVLMEIFGINDVNRILLLTRRPLREASLPEESSSTGVLGSSVPAPPPTLGAKQADGKVAPKNPLAK
ncbi:filamin abp280 repeat-containing protein [Cystoisospora suis]|uniref:Filamin abp280 repeat-containing protein n=1 Tax=Cystoisospora suis TaxID=483139 RepID=A0A2C6KZJ0_9APIC|nr:filamin abp280 repeat-containing protein [Cystoisospora suis]